MSPRSVQIWFQNRRQRLLKNNARARPTQSNSAWPSQRSNESAHVTSSPCGLEVMPSPRETSSEGSQSGNGSGDDESQANQPSRAHPSSFLPLHAQHPYPVMAFLAKNLSAAIQYEAAHAGRIIADAGQGVDIDLHSTLAALPLAVAAGHVDAGAAQLLADALHQQLVKSPAAVAHQHQPFYFPPGMEPSPPTCPTGGGQRAHCPSEVQHATGAPADAAAAGALDGLLLLSACADVQSRTPEVVAPPARDAQALAAAQAALLSAALLSAVPTSAGTHGAASGLVQGVTLLPSPAPVLQGEQFTTLPATATAATSDMFTAYEVLDVQPSRHHHHQPSCPFAPPAMAVATAVAPYFPPPCQPAVPCSGPFER